MRAQRLDEIANDSASHRCRVISVTLCVTEEPMVAIAQLRAAR